MIVDKIGRKFRNLRVSLTAACNYACGYCVPNGKRLSKASNELSAHDLLRAVSLLKQATGIEKLRITGGEPLISPKFDRFLVEVMRLGLEDVSLTTNGQFLTDKLSVIKSSGIKRLNVSLDSLNPVRFRQIARGGDLAKVLGGIDSALKAGIKIKINMVPMLSKNYSEILSMLEYCLERNIELRYIELMRMGHLATGNQFAKDFVSMASILEKIGESFDFHRIDAPHDSTAQVFSVAEKRGKFGIIPNESQPFCRACTRLRISSDGYLYGCLSSASKHDLKDVLRADENEASAMLEMKLIRALGDKKLSFQGETTVMKFIGG